MVQIRRENVSRRGRAFRRGFWRFFRFLLMAGVVPFVFLVRMFLLHEHLQWKGLFRFQLHPHQQQQQETTAPLRLAEEYNMAPISFRILRQYQSFQSDIVELSHCMVDDLVDETTESYRNFTKWAEPLLNSTLAALQRQQQQSSSSTMLTPNILDDMRDEFVLELLEIYASMDESKRRCDYSLYQPTIPEDLATQAEDTIRQIMDEKSMDASIPRLVFTIVAHTDVTQLERLISAIYMPHHVILVHLERRAPPDFVRAVNQLSTIYRNVVILQFASIVYKTDLVSHIHMRLLRWIHTVSSTLQLEYDYHVALDGSAFPLQEPRVLVDRLRDTVASVLLGELTHRGQRVRNLQEHVWKHKRLIYTRGHDDGTPKLHKRLPRSFFSNVQLPSWAAASLQYKSVSGNQIVVHRSVVQDLLASVQVRELFALAKYGCCCCLEERTWIAALHLTGYGPQALQHPFMFQVWGGETELCGSSMHNAVLSRNASLCFRVEDATILVGTNQTERDSIYFYGNETIDYLRDAKDRGFLFARKFQSENEESMQLLEEIQSEFWQLPEQEEEEEE